MITGFSLSPGGLLLPFHLGVLASLSHHGHINPDLTPLAGSSAGAIAVASHASGVLPARALEASIKVSAQCYNPMFVPAGRLMGALRQEMDAILDANAHHIINQRRGVTALAHRELYPTPRSRLVTQFDTRNCLMDAVCDSAMFPMFTSNALARTVRRHNEWHPRLVVDGIFAVSPERLGCPDFALAEKRDVGSNDSNSEQNNVDRTIMISCFPKELLSLSTNAKKDVIGPNFNVHNPVGQVTQLVKMACLASSRRELVQLYEDGWQRGEEWSILERRHAMGLGRSHDL